MKQMRNFQYLFSFFFLMLSLFMPAFAGQERIAVLVNAREQNKPTLQIMENMRKDLRNILSKRGGFNARILESKSEFRKGEQEYLLDVLITQYKPGSKAARIIVGFGAGAASLDIRYELISPRGKKLLSKEDGCGTSLDWRRLSRKLNENILAAISPVIESGGRGQEMRPEPSEPVKEEPPAKNIARPIREMAPQKNRGFNPYTEQSPSDSRSPAQRLKELDTLHSQGLVTDEEYKSKRQEVLDGI